jgi:hypothetical protein
MSLKWIYVDSHRTTGAHEIKVNRAVKDVVFRETERDICNLISIFGAARQGKSFLMNCLAGSSDIFTISNLSTPCNMR